MENDTLENPPPEIANTVEHSPDENLSPSRRKRRHKAELAQLQRILSVSHMRTPTTTTTDSRYSNIEDTEHSGSSKTHSSSHIELYMEFCWCFSCCFSSPLFRNYFESLCICQTKHNSDIENGNGNETENDKDDNTACSYCHYCNTRVYECIYKVFFSPIFDNDESKLTKTQKLVILIRLSFELYKTMIGSYLTIFTPQKCNDGICTLTQNLIPKDNMEVVALAVNSFMAFSLLCEYMIELTRERVLRLYFENDPRLPVEKEYFTNLLGVLDTKKATLLNNKTVIIRYIFQLYRRIGIVLLSIYIANICISGAVIYKNYYDKSSLFGFVTNALFIVLKMASILKIAIHSIQIPYSAYIESPIAFNSLKPEYIKPEIKAQYMFRNMEEYAAQNENAQYFMENRQYMRFLLENSRKSRKSIHFTDIPEKARVETITHGRHDPPVFCENSVSEIELITGDGLPSKVIVCKHRNSFS